MPDEAADKHSDNSVPLGEENASAPAAPREIVITDYTAVPQMIVTLKAICDAALPPQTKQTLTVLALQQVVTLGSYPDPRPVRLVLDLLPSSGRKIFRTLMRGMVAAAVAWLRAAEMTPDAIKTWLDDLLETNQKPFVLGFSADDAIRWFYDCHQELLSQNGRHGAGPFAFKLYRPDPSLSVTEERAKKQAFEILWSMRQMNHVPLKSGAIRHRN
jgi:hypothetical protein